MHATKMLHVNELFVMGGVSETEGRLKGDRGRSRGDPGRQRETQRGLRKAEGDPGETQEGR